MTAAEFEQLFAERSKTTVDRLRSMGRVPYLCNCDQPDCEGWQMGYIEGIYMTALDVLARRLQFSVNNQMITVNIPTDVARTLLWGGQNATINFGRVRPVVTAVQVSDDAAGNQARPSDN